MNKRRNRRDGELWWRLPVGMAGPRREDDTLVRAYPFAGWAVPVEQTQVPFLLHPSTSLVWRHGAHLFFQQSSSMIICRAIGRGYRLIHRPRLAQSAGAAVAVACSATCPARPCFLLTQLSSSSLSLSFFERTRSVWPPAEILLVNGMFLLQRRSKACNYVMQG
jgi:hypothetical protein